jgi:hypothetical protein
VRVELYSHTGSYIKKKSIFLTFVYDITLNLIMKTPPFAFCCDDENVSLNVVIANSFEEILGYIFLKSISFKASSNVLKRLTSNIMTNS